MEVDLSGVLIVEDDPQTRRTLIRGLERVTHTIHAAATGEDALDLAAEIPPRAMVVDICLPGITGFEVIRLQRERTPAVGVLVVTGQGSSAFTAEAADLSALYMPKPLKIELVRKKVRGLLTVGPCEAAGGIFSEEVYATAEDLLLDLREAHHAGFMAWVERRVQDRDDAEDLVQNAYVLLVQRFHSRQVHDDAEPPPAEHAMTLPTARSFVYGCLRRLSRNEIRTHRRRRRLTEVFYPDEYVGEEASLSTERSLRCGEVLARLTPKDAQLLTMRVLDDLAFAAVACRLGITEGAARTRFARAKRRAQALMGRC